jgi:DNA-binding XRE family transcriptional regulator
VAMAGRETLDCVELRRLRRAARMTQHDLARLLGLSRESVCRIEAGRLPHKRKLAVIQVWMERERHAHRVQKDLHGM